MQKKFLKVTASSIMALALFSSAHAAEGGASRSTHKIGLTAGVFSEAFPALTSLGVHYNLTPNIQLIGAYGSLTFTSIDSPGTTVAVKTWAGGVKVFPLKWSFSPFAGFFYSKTTTDGTFDILGSTIPASSSLSSMYATVGFDHQARVGFNIGAGAHYMLSPKEITDNINVVPYVYFGWYF